MSREIEVEMPREVIALEGRPETIEYTVDSAAATAGREAATARWAIGNPFADDAFHDDGNSNFSAEDQGPACGGTSSWEGYPRLMRRLLSPRPDVREVETHGIASRGGQTMNARNDDASPGIR